MPETAARGWTGINPGYEWNECPAQPQSAGWLWDSPAGLPLCLHLTGAFPVLLLQDPLEQYGISEEARFQLGTRKQ